MMNVKTPLSHTMRYLSVLLFIAGLALQGCGGAKKDIPSNPSSTSPRIVPIEAAPVVRSALSITKIYAGSLEGEEQANIVSKLPERITSIHVHVGEQVRAGQVLLELDKSGTSSQFYQAQASFRNAEKTLQRMKSLFGEGAISAQNLDGAQTSFDVASANFDAAKSAVELTTPIPGSVTAVNVIAGDLANPGVVLVTVANISRLRVTFSLNELDVPHIAVGNNVTIYSDAKPDLQEQGRVMSLSRSADERSRSFETKALFANTADHWFKPGMFVKVKLGIASLATVPVVPNEAIQADGMTNFLYVINGSRAMRRNVSIGISDGSRTEVLTGVSDHDSVATVGVNNLTDSAYVSVQPH